jgi:hypothetical protein
LSSLFLCGSKNAKTKAKNTFLPLCLCVSKRQNKSTEHFLCAFVVQKTLKQKHRTLPLCLCGSKNAKTKAQNTSFLYLSGSKKSPFKMTLIIVRYFLIFI